MRFDFPGGVNTDFSEALSFKNVGIQVTLAHIARFRANLATQLVVLQ